MVLFCSLYNITLRSINIEVFLGNQPIKVTDRQETSQIMTHQAAEEYEHLKSRTVCCAESTK